MEMTELKALLDEQGKAFHAFKETNDRIEADVKRLGSTDVVLTDKLGKIEGSLSALESMNQKITQAQLGAKNAEDQAAALKAQIDEIETKLNRPRPPQTDVERKAELKGRVAGWARAVIRAEDKSTVSLRDDDRKALADAEAEYKAMTVGNDSTGGYLAPVEYVAEIIKGVTEVSPARSSVRVVSITGKSREQPTRTGQFSARRVTETGTRSETTGLAYGKIEIDAPEMYAMIDISRQNLEDSAFDLEAEIRAEATEQFAVLEGSEVVSGSGTGACEGILSNASIQSTNSGTAATVADNDGQANGLITLYHALKTAYARNGVWWLNRVTLGSVRKLKDGDKNYVWQPGLALGVPNTILGSSYVEMPDMPNEGANAFPVAYGDWRRGYMLVDRIGMTMQRDPYSVATSGLVRFLFWRRVGGRVIQPEAIRLLKCST